MTPESNSLPTQDLPTQTGFLLLGAAMAAFVFWHLNPGVEAGTAFAGWHQARLYFIGLVMGLVLYHATFGFAGSWRAFILRKNSAGLEAQIVMLGVASLLFAPTLASGEIWGTRIGGAVAPVGLQVAAGAFLFGIGMQLGGGCGSGTLFTVGGGQSRMILTLITFCTGSFLASLHMQWWAGLPRLPGISLGIEIGWTAAVFFQLVMLAGLYWLIRRSGGPPASFAVRQGLFGKIVRGPWSLLFAAVALALLNWATLVQSGHPWNITWAFTLWGAKAATLVGWSAEGSWFWTGGFTERALASPVLADETSVMNIGIIIGAFIAATLAGRFAPVFKISIRHLMASVLGGLLMGYGARIGFGCNIGALFSGIASTSLHGWLWAVVAFTGAWAGVKLRPAFGLSNE